jgi:putative acetyltransferase
VQTPTVIIRPEAANGEDNAAIAAMLKEAFQGTAEILLVDTLREQGAAPISLVAIVDQRLVGHILFSPITIESAPDCQTLYSLAPLAVHPDYQRQGIGIALTNAGIAACRELGATAIVVIGHPEYYPRFGFVPAQGYGVSCQFIASDHPAFMLLELEPGALADKQGFITFHPAFGLAVGE